MGLLADFFLGCTFVLAVISTLSLENNAHIISSCVYQNVFSKFLVFPLQLNCQTFYDVVK